MIVTKNTLNKIVEIDFAEGAIILVNKPLKWTSFDLVNKFRFKLKHNTKYKNLKVGHAGTLDPLATGLVILCCGRKTKEIDKYQAYQKQYKALLKIGETTPSFDLESNVDNVFDISHVTNDLINSTIKTFIGEQEQMPPAFSAKKINGKPAYKLARKGKDVDLQSVKIFIENIEILKIDLPYIELLINCSKGTYIRSLANDIGKALNCGAYLAMLERTAIGEFKLEDALQVADFDEVANISIKEEKQTIL